MSDEKSSPNDENNVSRQSEELVSLEESVLQSAKRTIFKGFQAIDTDGDFSSQGKPPTIDTRTQATSTKPDEE